YRLRPSAPGEEPNDEDHHVNALGFRDREYSVSRPPGVTRVLGMGDSFVYGQVSVRYNFLRVAERELARTAPGLHAEVLLFGLPGYSPENEVGLLEETGLGLHPNLVVLNFFVGNDVTGIPVRGQVIRGRLYYPQSRRPWLTLLRKSQFFVLAENVFYQQWKRREQAASGKEENLDTRSVATPVSPLYLRIMSANLPIYLRKPDRDLSRLWDEAEGYLAHFDALCRRCPRARPLVVAPV